MRVVPVLRFVPFVFLPGVFLRVVLLPTLKPATAAAAFGHWAVVDHADNIGPFFAKAGGFGEFQESGRHLRPAAVAALFHAGEGIASLATVFIAGRHAAFFAGNARPVSQQRGSINAQAATIEGKSGGADGRAVSVGEMRKQPAIVDSGKAQELDAGRCAAKLAGGGPKGGNELFAGKHKGLGKEEA